MQKSNIKQVKGMSTSCRQLLAPVPLKSSKIIPMFSSWRVFPNSNTNNNINNDITNFPINNKRLFIESFI